MTGFIDLYTEGDTFLHRLDPRVKIAAVVLLTVLGFVLTSLASLLVLLAFIFLLLFLARASLDRTMFALKFVLRFMALIIVLWPFFDPAGEPVLATLGPVKITEPAIWRGVTSAVRVGCLATVWYILIFTTSQRDLVRALVKLGVRFDFGLALAIALRFFPTLGFTIDSIKDAQRARGLELDKGGLTKRARNYVAVLVPVIVSSLRTAETLALALQSRAYGARADRTYLRELSMRPADYFALAVVVAILVIPVVMRFVLGATI
ncbi:MAG: energy-coupling factor transporter transmembrane protein EcfT [Thermoplasmata archaeon]|jgi:energy-coupling factor transport system permease protein|nr:energy-coupling factor transporter transmembrane protein EcfT [Thermoplasmata archaeon]